MQTNKQTKPHWILSSIFSNRSDHYPCTLEESALPLLNFPHVSLPRYISGITKREELLDRKSSPWQTCRRMPSACRHQAHVRLPSCFSFTFEGEETPQHRQRPLLVLPVFPQPRPPSSLQPWLPPSDPAPPAAGFAIRSCRGRPWVTLSHSLALACSSRDSSLIPLLLSSALPCPLGG